MIHGAGTLHGAGNPAPPAVETDALIVGAGPAGLFAVFQLGLCGMRAHVVDILDKPGGQCAALYPEKPIYDIPALPRISGQELIDHLLLQSKPFNATFHMGEMVVGLEGGGDSAFVVETDVGRRISAKFVVLASGGGVFQPRKPPIPGIRAHEGHSVLYSVPEIEALRGHDVLILGGGDSALDWTVCLQPVASSVTLVHRRDIFRAASDSVRKMRDLVAEGLIDLHIGQVVSLSDAAVPGRINARIRKDEGIITIECSRILPFFGLSVDPGPVTQWGLALDGGLIRVETAGFESSRPGVYAIGDANVYPGKVRLILSGFHEAALMARAAFFRLNGRMSEEMRCSLPVSEIGSVS